MITVEKAKKLRAIIERAVAALELDNEAALECVELFPAWENGKAVHRRDKSNNTAESSIVAYKRTRRKAIGLRRSPPLFGAA